MTLPPDAPFPSRDKMMTSRMLAGRVLRYHTSAPPLIHRPTVAESSARVATLYCELWGLPRAEVLYYILHHDNGEFTGGDTPYSAKRLSAKLAEELNHVEKIGLERLGVKLPGLTKSEFKQFKICDILEMYELGVVETRMGNTYARMIVHDCRAAAIKIAEEMDDDWVQHPSNGTPWRIRLGYWLRDNDNADLYPVIPT